MSESPLMSLFKRAIPSNNIELQPINEPLLKCSKISLPLTKIYNPFAYPPDLKMAKEHGQARRVAIPDHLYNEMMGRSNTIQREENKSVDVCDCCGYVIANQY